MPPSGHAESLKSDKYGREAAVTGWKQSDDLPNRQSKVSRFLYQ